MSRVIVVFVLFTVLVSGDSYARTWHVEKDGSSDFSVIQEAADAAASGDTILVGPGWFEEYRMYTASNGDFAIYLNKTVPDLTVIGAGSEETFIGSSDESTWGDSDLCRGIISVSGIDHGLLRIENIGIFGVTRGIEVTQGSIVLENCIIGDCYRGIYSLRPARISNCEFHRLTRAASTNYGAVGLIIEDCLFKDCQLGLSCTSTPDISIRNCLFLNCSTAGLISGCSGEMWGCSVPDSWFAGIDFSSREEFHFYNNEIHSAHYSMIIASGDNLLCEGNIFSGTDRRCISIHSGTPTFHNNHILKESGLSVYLGGYNYEPSMYVDMTNNFWGTDDPDSISAWISDAYDETPTAIHGYVDFSPFADEEVPTEKTTMGGLKAMFR